MDVEKGKLTVKPENIFPIIKKALYSEREIFVRELISNAVDAICKYEILRNLGAASITEGYRPRIDINVDRFRKTLTIEDNGVGMTKDEVKKNIAEIAFSSAKEFIEKYQTEEKMIGYFGLGFYSAFLVAERVCLDTKSYEPHESACHWNCLGDVNYDLDSSERIYNGTLITLHIDQENYDLLDSEKISYLIKQYSDFVPYPIYLNSSTTPINSTNSPLYRDKMDLTSKDYNDFYHTLYPDANDCLFYIHINIDHPLVAKGILFFPSTDAKGGDIRLFSKRVFVQDHCQSLIPDWLSFLQGVIDIEDLPLIVSRDRFQEDPNIRKLRGFIQKKIAERIRAMAEGARADYIEFWLRYSQCMKKGAFVDERWFNEVKSIIMFRSSTKNLTTVDEYLSRGTLAYTDKIYYLTDQIKQGSYLEIFRNRNMEVLFLDDDLKLDFLLLQKYKSFMKSELELLRVDTVSDIRERKTEPEYDRFGMEESFREYVKTVLGVEVETARLYTRDLPAVFKVTSDDAERQNYEEIIRIISSERALKQDDNAVLVINLENSLIQTLYRAFENNRRGTLLEALCSRVHEFARIRFGRANQKETQKILSDTEKLMTTFYESQS